VISLPFSTSDAALDRALEALAPDVERACEGADAAHDLLHVVRVTRTAVALCQRESVAPRVAVTAAWLHELFNYPKGHPDSKRSGEVCAERAQTLLLSHGWEQATVESIRYAIAVHPFSLGITPTTIDAKILQDSDRLDSIGAIGAARCFATSAAMGRPFYHLDDPRAEARPLEDKQYALDHFAAKLFKISGVLHTESARKIAEGRAAFLSAFEAQLLREIDGQ
jgi:uncharacterized protein